MQYFEKVRLIKLTRAFSFQTSGSCFNMLFPCWNWEACWHVLLVYKTFTNRPSTHGCGIHVKIEELYFVSIHAAPVSGEAGPGPGSCFPSVYLSWCQQQRWPWSWTSPHQARPALPCPAVLYTHKQGRSYLLLVQMLKMYAMNVLKFFEEDIFLICFCLLKKSH